MVDVDVNVNVMSFTALNLNLNLNCFLGLIRREEVTGWYAVLYCMEL